MQQISNIFSNFPDEAKVWLFQADRALTAAEKEWITAQLEQFVSEWATHGSKLMAAAQVVGDYHLILTVDEAVFSASGCSLDSSTRFVKSIGNELAINFFNRLNILVVNGEKHELVSFSALNAYNHFKMYNPLVRNLGELRSNWIIPVSERLF